MTWGARGRGWVAARLTGGVSPGGRGHVRRRVVGRHDEGLAVDARPGGPGIARAMEAADRGRVHDSGVEGIAPHGVRAPIREPGGEPGPAVPAVPRAINPAAGRDPDVASLRGVEIPCIHRRVEDHPLGDATPARSAVPRPERLPPRAGVERAAIRRIERERLDLKEAGHALAGPTPSGERRTPSSPPAASMRGSPGASASARVVTAPEDCRSVFHVAPRSSLTTTRPPESSPATAAQSRPGTAGSAMSAVT